ncbi:Two-component system protein A-like protein [Emericellopsis cladophorae]|uniref:histidine kinase n=1 Tax=Emericellopsis cladophorae TaxID=2686198 RepID=A0A9Q0BEN6_9HYPO|nr:Two-component system protein A-like protein [Emericellopsis cladophorae]KAI6783107.1 Two-component system protein A-like protein [Emericellopsis cladophorae]
MTPPDTLNISDDPRAFRPAHSITHDADTAVDDEAGSSQTTPLGQPTTDPKPTQTRPPLRPSPGIAAPGTGDDLPHSLGGSGVPRMPSDGLKRPQPESLSPLRLAMPTISPGQLAFSALQYLPVPTLVLSSLKTVLLANEALGRMLGIVDDHLDEVDASTTLEHLRGQSLSQVGIDMIQDGQPVWVTWEVFLDNIVNEMGVRPPAGTRRGSPNEGPDTPNTAPTLPIERRLSGGRPTQDAVVDVVVSRKGISKTAFDSRYKSQVSEYQVFAKMIISIWELEDRQTYFTLTFTSTQSTPSSFAAPRKSVAKPSILEAADRKTIVTPLASNPPSVASSRDSSEPSFYSPSAVTMSATPFPPMGPPSVASRSSTPSVLQKMLRMKDALLDHTQMPILAMWKDGSVTFPNKAARRLFRKDSSRDASGDGYEVLKKFDLWTEDFSRALEIEEYPISILLRTEEAFSSMRIGMYNADGEQLVMDVLGEVIRDESTGEFLAGVVTGRDITGMTREITEIKERDEERFRLICDTMPQLVWTARPDGYHDFFNTRWYTYTGLTPEVCLGKGWQLPFHPDDMAETTARWAHCLKTGDPYVTEYRCLSKEGEWRWFLGRALAVRNKETGQIEKWFGTCTDVHESMETKLNAKRTKQQLLSVIAHSHVTIFTADMDRRVTMLEGALIWDSGNDESRDDGRWFIGQDVYTVFSKLTEHLSEGLRPHFLGPVEDIIKGNVAEDVVTEEHPFNGRWYRTRFLPMYGKRASDGRVVDEASIEGVIGVIMDVTELRHQKHEAEVRLKEKRKAVANEAAAREATRLKSQFLANMSHEIRTPITGVLGMAELLGGMELDAEQREYVENIYSSANSLLTVINDILDFSKVESGRLDVEEVQFSLSLIVKEVVRMLQFAVEKKNLDFRSDIEAEIETDMVVIGDPGRVRQIITNLLTNSIKFTNQGYVRFSVQKEKETADSVTVRFVVEDTGIGIQDEVRKKLFQPFSQGDASTARRFGGTGLGLTICKNLLELMRGSINLQSKVGSGTTATFFIPFSKVHGRKEAHPVQAGAIPDRLQSELSLSCNSSEQDHLINSVNELGQSPAPLPMRRASLRTPPITANDLPRSERAKMLILVVEDNPVNQKIATKTISKLGFQVTAAWNGREALEYVVDSTKGKNPRPDVILMDVQMPVIDGYKTTHLMRHHLPYKHFVQDVPIVAMTASAIQGDREKCTKAGMDDYLSKPVTMSILERMLIRWCLQRRRACPSPAPSDCSEHSEHCENADIPHVAHDEQEPSSEAPGGGDNSALTPRPLTTNGQSEPSPFDSPMPPQEVRRPEGEKEHASLLQETKLIDAAGGPPTTMRSSSFQAPSRGEALTEANMNKLKSEARS